MTTQQADHPIRKVKIKIWRVIGQCGEIGVFFTRDEAYAANSGACGGWGDVEEEIREAIRV